MTPAGGQGNRHNMPSPNPSQRAFLMRVVVLVACLLTMLASTPVWRSERAYPVLPLAPCFPILPAAWDVAIFAVVLACLVAAVWWPRAGILAFLAGALFLVFEDQARLQPWFYMYGVMLLMTLAGNSAGLQANRIALSVVYFWSGIQK